MGPLPTLFLERTRAPKMPLRRRVLSALMAPTVRASSLLLACIVLLLLTHHERREPLTREIETTRAIRIFASEAKVGAASSNTERHAFFLQVSNSTLQHLPRLLHRIWHPENLYAIHFDVLIEPRAARRALLAANLTSGADPVPTNVLTMPQEVVNYRGVSMLLNTISAMQFLLDADPSWRYFINLSASDYPLISPRLLRELLGHRGPSRNFFSFAPPEAAAQMVRNRMTEFHVDDALTFRQRKRPVETVHALNPMSENLGFSVSYSEAWMINSRAFCKYVVSSPVARKTLISFAYSLSSPEHYFSTLVRNDKVHNATVVSHSMRLILWKFGDQRAKQHPFYLDELPGFETKIANSPLFFARKFRQPHSRLKDIIDARSEDPLHEHAVRQHFYNKIGLLHAQK